MDNILEQDELGIIREHLTSDMLLATLCGLEIAEISQTNDTNDVLICYECDRKQGTAYPPHVWIRDGGTYDPSSWIEAPIPPMPAPRPRNPRVTQVTLNYESLGPPIDPNDDVPF